MISRLAIVDVWTVISMDKKLPFVWRTTGRVVTPKSKTKLAALISEFMEVEEIDGFLRYERHRIPNDPCSILIVLPGTSFYKNEETYRSDIRWMWKVLARNQGRIEIGYTGSLFLFVTDEVSYYNPGPDVIKGSFEDAELLWSWIKYVVSKSWWKQKKGQLRGIFASSIDTPTMLKKLSTRLILDN